MRTTVVSEQAVQLTRLRFVNAYLVREDDGLTLIDTTLGGAAPALIEAAQAAGAPIRRIAITHAHGDHAGSVDALRERLGADVEVLMPEIDARILAGEQVVEGKLRGSWPKVRTRPDRTLSGGDTVGSLEVVASPGHTPGHIAFLDTREGTLIAGDVFTTFGGVTVTNHFQLPFPLPAMATWDRDLDLQSAQVLRALEPSLLLVGHGAAVREPAAAMDRAIARAG